MVVRAASGTNETKDGEAALGKDWWWIVTMVTKKNTKRKHSVAAAAFEPEGLREGSGGQSGDLQGLNIAHDDGKISPVPKIRMLKEPPGRKGFYLAINSRIC